MTSHDVVDAVRRLAGLRRVGHTGTLDPGAAGVLVLCLGRATRLSEFLMDVDKEYRVELRLGIRTSTGDAYGEVLPPPEAAAGGPAARGTGGRAGIGPSAWGRTAAAVDAVLRRFTGEILQVPPMVSAIHHEGARLYELARRGEVVDVQPRPIVVHRIEIVTHDRDWTRLLLHVTCGKGAYIRKLCADIGDALGVGGYAHFMVRTRTGTFEVEHARTLEELGALAAEGALEGALMSMDDAVGHLPAVDLSDHSVSDVLHGHPVPVWKAGRVLADQVPVRLRSRRGALVALARVEQGLLRPFKVLAGAAGGAAERPSRPARTGPSKPAKPGPSRPPGGPRAPHLRPR
ncbi:MAG TPA: tRNA pseudouridine(55) synthase TruB [bacterium]|nr:tRNA pseudouridine(55) synthase TruB [bacterium]